MNANIINIHSIAYIFMSGAFVTAGAQLNDYADPIEYNVGDFSFEDQMDSLGLNSSYNEMTTFTALKENQEKPEKELLNNFVSSILNECKSLEPEYSKLIDDNFWDLI
ncbi:MAG: hypothetical protein HP007_10765 [Bacteroides sp.]|nr:hypothetical protein [Bacteroides sp.]MBU3835095.1 hypothetical protein [Candidatus Phocaeicola merdigallinarum]